jgi:uncharacterized protein
MSEQSSPQPQPAHATPPAERPELPQLASATGPLGDRARIVGLDFTRGLALLGITFVNIELFAEPFAEMMDASKPEGQGPAGNAFYWFVTVFCASKFYPLFSLLFGIGLAMIFASTQRAGRSFGWTAARRLAVLAGFGIAHVVLLWYGDILILYSIVGVAMLLLARLSPRGLFIAAGVFFGVGVLGAGLFSLLTLFGSPGETPPTPAMPEAATALQQFREVLQSYQPGPTGMDPRLAELERQIFAEGPFSAALAVRLFNYLFSLVFLILIMSWQVAACFCFGAALLKIGFFHGRTPRWHTVFVALGLGVGLPMQVLAAWALQDPRGPWQATAIMATQVGGPLVSLMYLSVFTRAGQTAAASLPVRAVANLGRMGLTGYLGVSLLMQAYFSHWGLAKFGQVGWGERWLIVAAVWLAVLVFANLWLGQFRFGPLEWLWRSLTYLRVQPIRKAPGSGEV